MCLNILHRTEITPPRNARNELIYSELNLLALVVAGFIKACRGKSLFAFAPIR